MYELPEQYVRYNRKECEECGDTIHDAQHLMFCSEECNVKYVIREEVEDIESEKRKA